MPKNDKRDNDWACLIRAAFKKSGLSMKQLSDRAGVHYASVHGFLATGKDPRLSTTRKMCRVLGLVLIRKDS